MLHDFLLRIISTYLRNPINIYYNNYNKNNDIIKLMSLNQRFYSIRYIFIKQLCLNSQQSKYAYTHKPYNWNKVHAMFFFNTGISDVSALGKCHSVEFISCHNIRDVSALGTCHSVMLHHCENIRDVSALGTCHSVMLYYCDNIRDVSALKDVPNLKIIHCNNIIKN